MPRMPTKDQIKAARLALGESQAAFATRFGVDQATVNRWENKGVPTRGAAPKAIERLLDSLRERAA